MFLQHLLQLVDEFAFVQEPNCLFRRGGVVRTVVIVSGNFCFFRWPMSIFLGGRGGGFGRGGLGFGSRLSLHLLGVSSLPLLFISVARQPSLSSALSASLGAPSLDTFLIQLI